MQFGFVGAEGFGDAGAVVGAGGGRVLVGGLQLVLGGADLVRHLRWGEALVVDAGGLHGATHGGDAVGLVVDGEVAGDADRLAVATQDAHADGVERAQPHAGGGAAEQHLDALAHLARRLVGEGDREDLLGTGALGGDDVGDAVGQHARLATAGAGEDQQGSVGGLDRAPLRLVEAGEQIGDVQCAQLKRVLVGAAGMARP